MFSERTLQPGIMPRRRSPRTLLAFGSVWRAIYCVPRSIRGRIATGEVFALQIRIQLLLLILSSDSVMAIYVYRARHCHYRLRLKLLTTYLQL